MKKLLIGILALGMVALQAPSASALVCAAGVHRAGCVTRHGTVVTHHRPVHRHCFWRAGVRVCR